MRPINISFRTSENVLPRTTKLKQLRQAVLQGFWAVISDRSVQLPKGLNEDLRSAGDVARGAYMICTLNRSMRNFDLGRSGVSRMPLYRRSRNWIPSRNSRRQRNSESSWKIGSRNRSDLTAVPAGRIDGYSARSEAHGSILVARRAGSHAAISPTAISSSVTIVNAIGSDGVTPIRNACSTRVAPAAPARPALRAAPTKRRAPEHA